MRTLFFKILLIIQVVAMITVSSIVANAAAAVPMKFFSPLLYRVGANEVVVAIFGKTTPGSRITLDRSLVVQIEPADAGGALKPKIYSTISDPQGYFRLGATLPKGVLQATLLAKDPLGNSTPFVVDLKLSSSEATLDATLESDDAKIAEWRAQLKEKTSGKPSDSAIARNQSMSSQSAGRTQPHPGRFSLGVGGNYQSFTQSTPDVTIKFDQFNVPSFEASLSYTTEHWLAWLGAASIQGEGAVIVANRETTRENYNWQWAEIGGGAALAPKGMPKNFGMYLTGAVSLQSQPIFISSNGQDYRLEIAKLTLAALGVSAVLRLSDPSLVEFGIRYLHPVSNSLSGGSVTPETAVEGQMAYFYSMKNKPIVLGWNWRVLSHKYKYDLGQLPDGRAFVGSRRLLHSNLVLSLGYAFQ